jgi:DNA-binding MarR family transcriptional regulator
MVRGGPLKEVILPASLAGQVGYLLRRAYVRAEDAARALLPRHRHVKDFAVLAVLDTFAPLSQHQLAERLGMHPTIMVKVVDGLEQEGLVGRTRDPADRRQYALRLTPSGRGELAALEPDVARADAQITQLLTPPERDRLLALLAQVLAPGLDLLPDSIRRRTGFLVVRAYHMLRRLGSEAMVALGVEPRHFAALTVLTELGGGSQRQLADALGVSEPMVVEVVDGLLDRGLVSRERNPADRRSYRLSLTEAGRTTHTQAESAIRAVARTFTARIGEPGEEELGALLRTLLTGTRAGADQASSLPS